jgi:hypothetical protein
MNIISALNNREIAVAIWLFIVLLWALSKSSVRQSIPGLFKALFVKSIIVPLTIMLLYILLMVMIFKIVGFWDTSAIKDTILWTASTAIATFFSLNNVVRDKHYFRKAILDNLKLVVILEFLVNFYTSNLIAELLIVPIVTCVVLMSAVAASKPELKRVSIILNYVLGIIGLVLIVIAIRELFVDVQNLATLKNVRDFFLPPLFTIAFLPFVYLMVLYMKYESRKKKAYKQAGA